MHNLLLELQSPNGNLKTWRLRAQAQKAGARHLFGSSKHADLRSPDPSVRGVQGVIEWQQDHWVYHNLELDPQNPNKLGDYEFKISGEMKINCGNAVLKITPYEERENLFRAFENLPVLPADQLSAATHQLFVVTSNGHILETAVRKANEKYIPSLGFNFDVVTTPSSKWMHAQIPVGNYKLELYQRSIQLDAKLLRTLNKDEYLAKDGRGPLYATLIGAGLIALLAVLAPTSNDAGQAAKRSAPPVAYREIKLQPPQKLHAAAPAPAPTTQAKTSTPPPEGRSQAQAIKALGSTSRLSSLIGKISASAQKSSNIVIANGVAAGSAPTGRALAALGKDNSGQDWGAQGKGEAVHVGTMGVAGGHGVAGMGNLSNGKTGSGGAELLEDESEIVGGLDREVIAQYIRTQIGQILYCYERQLSATPDLYGKVAVRFTIGPKGEVETQRIGDSTLRNAAVEGCILQRVAKWKFPTPEGGTKVNVTYPFLFKSTN